MVREITVTKHLTNVPNTNNFNLEGSLIFNTSMLIKLYILTSIRHSCVDGLTPSIVAIAFRPHAFIPKNQPTSSVPMCQMIAPLSTSQVYSMQLVLTL